MHALDLLGDPVRRRILELMRGGERTAGELADTIGDEFGISQPGVSRHLRLLREHGFTTVRADGTRRLYALAPGPLREASDWLDAFSAAWTPRLDALETEIARGKRARRRASANAGTAHPAPSHHAPAAHHATERPDTNQESA